MFKFKPKNSREEECSSRFAKNSNIYQSQTKVGNKIDFIVVNLMPQISKSDLTLVINALKQYCDNGFAPVWGTTATFTVLDFGVFPKETDGKAVIYLVDQLKDGGENFQGAIAIHYIVMPPPNDTIDEGGCQPSQLVDGAPEVPVSTPVILIPYGNGSYGLSADSGNNLMDSLGTALSHEVFETAVDPFPIGYGACYQVFVGENNTHMYVKEICDPVEGGPTVNINGIALTNFVYPSYFNPLSLPGTQFDYRKTVTSPLTPCRGLQFGLLVDRNRGGMYLFVDFSSNDTPEKVNRYILTDIYPPYMPKSIMRHLKEKIRLEGNLSSTELIDAGIKLIERKVFEF